LAQTQAAVIGRHALVPMSVESTIFQSPDCPLDETSILETTSRQYNAILTGPRSHVNDHSGQRVVKTVGHKSP
jgi:hypothetical protein